MWIKVRIKWLADTGLCDLLIIQGASWNKITKVIKTQPLLLKNKNDLAVYVNESRNKMICAESFKKRPSWVPLLAEEPTMRTVDTKWSKRKERKSERLHMWMAQVGQGPQCK